MAINWKVTREEAATIAEIVERAVLSFHGDRTTLAMDITATHANGCPLDLQGLLDAEPFDFAHDVAGISRHINRDTGALMDCFLPRYAKGQD